MILHVRSMSPLAHAFPTLPASSHPRLQSLFSAKLWKSRRLNQVASPIVSNAKRPGTLAHISMCSPPRSALSSPRRIRFHEQAIRRAAQDLAQYRTQLTSLSCGLRQVAFEQACKRTVALLDVSEKRILGDATSEMQTEDFDEASPALPRLKTVYLRPSLLPVLKRKRNVG